MDLLRATPHARRARSLCACVRIIFFFLLSLVIVATVAIVVIKKPPSLATPPQEIEKKQDFFSKTKGLSRRRRLRPLYFCRDSREITPATLPRYERARRFFLCALGFFAFGFSVYRAVLLIMGHDVGAGCRFNRDRCFFSFLQRFVRRLDESATRKKGP
nr:hypothetical protein [Pandoravirus belohorizontensis]